MVLVVVAAYRDGGSVGPWGYGMDRPRAMTATGSPVFGANAPSRGTSTTTVNQPPPVRGAFSPWEQGLSDKVAVPIAGDVEVWVLIAVAISVVVLFLALH